MTTINILHFSDLHEGTKEQIFLWGNIESELLADLEKVTAYAGNWDLLVVTGDLVYSGTEQEFVSLNEKLKRIYRKLNSMNCNPVLVTVPGNHDLLRPDKSEPIVEVMKEWGTKTHIHHDFWNNPDNKYRLFLAEAFKNYNKWQTTHPFPKLTQYKAGLLPGDFAGTFIKDNVALGLIGLNTSFVQVFEGDAFGKLDLHPLQFVSSVGKFTGDWVNNRRCNHVETISV